MEVLDISDGELWLVKTVDKATGNSVEGLVRQSWLVSKPPPSRPPASLQNGMELQQNGSVEIGKGTVGLADRVQLRGHPPPTSSAPAAVLPGTLFGIYEPPKSMIFGKPEVSQRDIPIIEQAIEKATPILNQAPPTSDQAPPLPVPVLSEPASDELKRLQDASVNSHIPLDSFDPVEVYVAIADFDASEESNISLRAGDHVQVSVTVM